MSAFPGDQGAAGAQGLAAKIWWVVLVSTETGGGRGEPLVLMGPSKPQGSHTSQSYYGIVLGQQRMREGYQGISGGSRARKQRRHSSCVWEGEGSREKQIKGQRRKK